MSQDAPERKPEPPNREEVRLRNLYRKLLQSGYAEQPFIENQDSLLPDTVKVVGRTTMVLDLADPKQHTRYGELLTSSLQRGRELIVFEEHKSFESTASWKVFLKVDVRAFKCLTNRREAELLIDSLKETYEAPLEEDELDPEPEDEQDTEASDSTQETPPTTTSPEV